MAKNKVKKNSIKSKPKSAPKAKPVVGNNGDNISSGDEIIIKEG